MQCPDFTGHAASFTLQNSLEGDKSSDFYLIIDTCENLKEYTNKEFCQPTSEVLDIVENLEAFTKVRS